METSTTRQSVSTVSGNELTLTSPTSILSPHMPKAMARRGPMYQPIPDGMGSRENPVGTLPRTSSPYGPMRRHAKTLEAVATVAHKYLSLANQRKRTSIFTMRDEEMTYLRAIERGDIEEVKQILSIYDIKDEKSSDSSDSDIAEVETEGGSSSKAQRSKSATNRENSNRRPSLHVEGELPFIVEMKCVKPNSPGRPSPSLKYRDSKLMGKKGKGKRNGSTEPLKNKNRRKSDAYKSRIAFDKNCRDQWGRTGLFIATSRRNLEMVEVLLDHQVSIDECLYHSIDFGFYDVVELLLNYNADRDQVICGEDSFYPPGLTPIQLAAHKNDFIMLKILHNKGFRIMGERGSKKKRIFSRKGKDSDSESDDNNFYLLEKAWDQSNDRMLYYRALSSPAYLIMMHTEGGFADEPQDHDFLDRIFRLYGKLKKKASREPDARTLYLQLGDQVEDFACDLLNEVRSAEDLSNLLRFDPPGHARTTLAKNHLLPVQTACEVKMKHFVAHQHCQLSLSILRIGTLFDRDQGWKTFLTRALLAILFPILCLVFIVAPDSWFGSFLRNPMVNLSCHIVSDVTFLILMIIRLILKSTESLDCLGTIPNGLEIVILLWVAARTVNEIKRARESGLANIFANVWRMNDFATLLIFFVVICLRTVDIVRFGSFGKNATVYYCNRTQWKVQDAAPVLVSEGLLSAVYLLIFIRTLEKMYIDRTFGPLQLSLDKMLLDIFRFLIIFMFTFSAFACGMVQLYWSYYKPLISRVNGTVKECEEDGNDPCYPVYATLVGSILEQFWTIFGYGYKLEPPQALGTPDQALFTEAVGLLMSGLFHAWAVVVMLNMLIAMMSHSFDRVRDNAEVEWKFHRTNTWMKFIRKGIYPRPPPMNLIPSPRDIASLYQSIKNTIKHCCKRKKSTPQRRMAQRADNVQDPEVENSRYRLALNRVTERYLRKHLLEEFQHEDENPLLLQQQSSKNTSPRKLSALH